MRKLIIAAGIAAQIGAGAVGQAQATDGAKAPLQALPGQPEAWVDPCAIQVVRVTGQQPDTYATTPEFTVEVLAAGRVFPLHAANERDAGTIRDKVVRMRNAPVCIGGNAK